MILIACDFHSRHLSRYGYARPTVVQASDTTIPCKSFNRAGREIQATKPIARPGFPASGFQLGIALPAVGVGFSNAIVGV